MTDNVALWLPKARAPFAIGPAPLPQAGADQIVVRSRAIAVNPFERMVQAIGGIITPWLSYPLVLGSDVAGDVVMVGPNVSDFSVGDRVFGFAAGQVQSRNSSAEGAFQKYVVLLNRLAAHIPADMSYEQAAVMPLALMTAASCLFQKNHLALSPPAVGTKPTGRSVVIWGGSSSVGCHAIQLAVAAGYDVVATASPRNFAYLKKLGARRVFDYRDPAVARLISEDLSGRLLAGAVSIGKGSARGCIKVLGRCTGDRALVTVTPATSFDDVPPGAGRWAKLTPAFATLLVGGARRKWLARRFKVKMTHVWAGDPVDNGIGAMIFRQFLPAAFRAGKYVAAPDPAIVGAKLSSIPDALERQRQGVSLKKMVVLISGASGD